MKACALSCAAVLIACPQLSNGQTTTTFQYDALGRLTRSDDSQGRTVVYQYDAAGNRITLSNGAAPGEIVAKAFSASSNRGGFGGLTSSPTMHDLIFNSPGSAHVTQADSLAFVQADLGELKTIDHVDLAAPDRALDGGGVDALNGAQVQYSPDASTWTSGSTVAGAVAGVYTSVALGGVQARYVRVVKSGAVLGLGDFRFFSTPRGANHAPVAVDDVRSKLNKGETTTFDPRLNDTDADGDALTITAVSPASHGQTSFTSTTITHVPDAGYVGDDTFTYTIADDRGGFATAKVTLTYKDPAGAPNGNKNPIAVDDGGPNARIFIPYAAGFSTPTIHVLDNDSDPDGDTISIDSAGPVQHGYLDTSGGVIRYFPIADGFNGFEDFPYKISDGKGGTATARVWVRIGNNYPQPVSDNVTLYHNTSISIWPLANDRDADGDPLTIGVFTQPAHGSVIRAGDGVLIYTPNHDYVGQDSFTYTALDDHGGGGSGNVYVTVDPGSPNNAPIAHDDGSATSRLSVPSGMTASLMVLNNDSDPDGDPVTISAFTQPTHGVVTRVAASPEHLTYTPAAGYLGADSVDYTISDGRGGTATATAYLQVVAESNQPPVALNDSYTGLNYRGAVLAVRANDYDVNSDPTTIVSVTQPAHGAVVINSGATVTYTPTNGYVGADSFAYTISDGRGGTATASVSLNVTGNLNPVALDDTVTGRLNKTVSLDGLLANDSDPNGDSLSILSVAQPGHGWTSATSYTVLYTPSAGYTGVDSFTYTVTDGQGGTATATVTITVPANRSPVAVADSYAVVGGASTSLDVLTNDTDLDGDSLTIASVGSPAHGTASVVGQAIVYQPAAGYVGADSFSYGLSDGQGGTSSAVVSITVSAPPNHAPTAAADAFQVSPDITSLLAVLANDTDPDGDSLSISAVSQPAHGTTSISGNQVAYTPTAGFQGSDSFTYTASDGRGGASTATVSIIFTNKAPVLTNDTFVVAYNSTTTLDVLANDRDPNGDPLTITWNSTPAKGAATIVGGTKISYTPPTNYQGAASFTYIVTDGRGGSATATVSITVSGPANRVPTARDASFSVPYNTATALPVKTYASDPDGDALTIVALGAPAHGTATITGSTATYTPSAGYSGSDSFTFTVSDGRGGTATATASITVLPPVAPVDDGPVSVDYNTSKVIDVLANDSPSNGALTLVTVTQPEHGTTIIANGRVSYSPFSGYIGPDSFTYTAADSTGASATATVLVNVTTPANQALAVANDVYTVAVNDVLAFNPLSNDTAPTGGSLSVVSFSAPSLGTLRREGGSFFYQSYWGYAGTDMFTYTVTDGQGHNAIASVTINVTPIAGNHAPVAVSDVVWMPDDSGQSANVLQNDTDADGDALQITALEGGTDPVETSLATYTLSGDSIWIGGNGKVGTETVHYTVRDGKGGVSTGTLVVHFQN